MESAEERNDRLAREHPIDDYYARSPLPIRLIERRRLAIIRDFLGPCAGLDVAEVGSGGGHVLALFPAARLTAIDVSSAYLEVARRRLAGYDARFVHGAVEELDRPPFDRVICSEVLEHVGDPDAAVAAIARLLRPGGVAVITIPNDPLIARLKSLAWGRVDWGGDEHHLHRWTPAEFERWLAPHLRVTARRHAPFDALPIRACFRCVR